MIQEHRFGVTSFLMHVPVYAAAPENMGFRALACMLQGAQDSVTLSSSGLEYGGWCWDNGGYAATELPRALLPFFDR